MGEVPTRWRGALGAKKLSLQLSVAQWNAPLKSSPATSPIPTPTSEYTGNDPAARLTANARATTASTRAEHATVRPIMERVVASVSPGRVRTGSRRPSAARVGFTPSSSIAAASIAKTAALVASSVAAGAERIERRGGRTARWEPRRKGERRARPCDREASRWAAEQLAARRGSIAALRIGFLEKS